MVNIIILIFTRVLECISTYVIHMLGNSTIFWLMLLNSFVTYNGLFFPLTFTKHQIIQTLTIFHLFILCFELHHDTVKFQKSDFFSNHYNNMSAMSKC